MAGRWRRLWDEVHRLGWLIGVVVLMMLALDVVRVFHELSKWALVAYVLAKASVLLIAFHLVRSQLFPYVDVKALFAAPVFAELDPTSRLAAAIYHGARVLAACLLIGLLGVAFILGGLLAV